MTDLTVGKILILGIGNILWADEGFGVRCVEAIDRDFEFTDDVTVMDGGTQGLNLVAAITEADWILLFDAVDFGGKPGELAVVRNEEVPSFFGAKKMSLHQTGFQDVLACADLLNQAPEKITLIGVMPEELEDYGGSLTETVRNCIPPAIEIGLKELAEWGVTPVKRTKAVDDGVVLSEVGLDVYEKGRPSAEMACRIGDERVLTQIGAMGPHSE